MNNMLLISDCERPGSPPSPPLPPPPPEDTAVKSEEENPLDYFNLSIDIKTQNDTTTA